MNIFTFEIKWNKMTRNIFFLQLIQEINRKCQKKTLSKQDKTSYFQVLISII